MWYEIQAKLLRDEIDSVIASLSGVVGLYEIIREPLKKNSRALSTEIADYRIWPLLPMVVCESVCGTYEQALPIASSRQFLLAAADVFDDIEDADSAQSISARYGAAIATNIATTLLILAEKAVTRLTAKHIADETIVRVMDILNSCYVTACAGQHLDLSHTSDLFLSEDDYFRIAGMKSASQTECACRLGALLAGSNTELIDKLSFFGYSLGMASQIINDIQGIIDGSDIIKPKVTLPVIFTYAQADDHVRRQFEIAFNNAIEHDPDPSEIRNAIFGCGAIHYAMIKAEFYKQQADDILSEVELLGIKTERLRLFIE